MLDNVCPGAHVTGFPVSLLNAVTMHYSLSLLQCLSSKLRAI